MTSSTAEKQAKGKEFLLEVASVLPSQELIELPQPPPQSAVGAVPADGDLAPQF